MKQRESLTDLVAQLMFFAGCVSNQDRQGWFESGVRARYRVLAQAMLRLYPPEEGGRPPPPCRICRRPHHGLCAAAQPQRGRVVCICGRSLA